MLFVMRAISVRGGLRWRLVLSYVCLTVLTTCVLVILALVLMRRNLAQQERDLLMANAQAIARQAAPALASPSNNAPLHSSIKADLEQLAKTSAFLGDSRIRILDSHQFVLADSGSTPPESTLLLVAQPISGTVANTNSDPGTQQNAMPAVVPAFCFATDARPNDHPDQANQAGWRYGPLDVANGIRVNRKGGSWGNRLSFTNDGGPRPTSVVANVASAGFTSDGAALARIESTTAPTVTFGYVEVSSDSAVENGMMTATASSLGIAGAVATGIAALIGLVVTRGLTSPLTKLAQAATRMGHGDLTVRAMTSGRASAPGRDEIAQLATQFNQMADRLQASFAQLSSERDTLRRFMADASHELRTPIATLKVYNELMQNEAADDVAARERFLSEGRAQLDRLEWITRNLLDLSRLDAGLSNLDLSEHDLRELVEAAGRAYAPIAKQRNVSLATSLPQHPVMAKVDRARIELALSNLLDNALKFTPTGGRVEIGIQQHSDATHIQVRDTGIGIAPIDQPRIFERFFRAENGAQNATGSGLGLALVKSVAQAHGGRVFVESVLGKGSTFTLELARLKVSS